MSETRDPTDAELLRHAARQRLIPYTHFVMPWFIIEEVHCAIAGAIEEIANRNNDRLAIFMPPRTGKSTLTSVLTPSWFAGRWPSDKIMQIGYKVELPRRFSRQTMGIMKLPIYGEIFPGVELARDARSAGYWRIHDINAEVDVERGEYQAAGTTSGIAGSGFNLGLVDDPLSEQDKDSKLAKDRVWEWWGTGFYTRRQPERNAIILTMTRWAKDDLAGRLLGEAESGNGDKWRVLNIPAILDGETAKKLMIFAKNYGWLKDPREHPEAPVAQRIAWLREGKSFSPRRWPTAELERSHANMRERDWNALYMGNPQEDEGAILKRKWWRLWKGKLPECHTILQFYDTAFEEHEKADYSACTTWGIFEHNERDGRPANHVILLGRWKKRIASPDLPKVVVAFCHGSAAFSGQKTDEPGKYADMQEQVQDLLYGDPLRVSTGFHPDKVIIENKASGQWLWREVRRNKEYPVPAYPWNPPKGDRGTQLGKYARAMKGAIVLEQGCIWYQNAPWCDEVINECAECHFDGSDESDDLPDTVTMAFLFFRQHFLVEFETDIDDEAEAEAELEQREQQSRRFYG